MHAISSSICHERNWGETVKSQTAFALFVCAALASCARSGDNLAATVAAPPLNAATHRPKNRAPLDWEFKREGRAPTDPACVTKAVAALKGFSPSAFDTYKRLNDPDFFASFIAGCADAGEFYLSDVPSAVHESVHAVRATTESYHLVTSELLPVPSAPGYFPPHEIADTLLRDLKSSDDYFDTYIRPGGEPASSKDDFTYLLDELNAYTNDLQATMDLTALTPLENREAGVVAMMSFVAGYISFAQAHQAATFAHLGHDQTMRATLVTLWAQADKVLARSCKYRAETAFDDTKYLDYLCDAGKTGAMAAVLGHSVRCPNECRKGSRSI